MEKEKVMILNVVVCYYNEDEVLKYAGELSKQKEKKDITLVIVINGINEKAYSLWNNNLRAINLNILTCFSKENLGYLNGLIFGLKYYKSLNMKLPEWTIFSNTDILFQSDIELTLFTRKNYDPNIWVLGPSIYSPQKGSYDNPKRTERYSKSRLIKIKKIYEMPIVAYFYMILSFYKSKFLINNKKDSNYVYSVHGCFFFIKGEFANILCKKEYGGFLYSEEAFIAEEVRNGGKKIFYDSEINIIHNEHSTTNKLNYKKKSAYFAQSLSVILEEYFFK